tara:strand:+ start:374 stop:889 length:516 start_codon:yes stop_codon:yes gene_type:complete
MVNLRLPILTAGEDVVEAINKSGQSIIGKLTKQDILGAAGNGVKGALDGLGNLVGVIPLAGGATAYLFGQGGKAVKIVTTKADGVIKSTGEVANSVLQGANDLVVLTLRTAKGVVKNLTSKVGVGVQLGGRRKRRKSKKRRRKKSKKGGYGSPKNKSKKRRRSRKKRRRKR